MNLGEKQNIMTKLKDIEENLTQENIESATKEELIEYLALVDKLKAMLTTTYETK